jgi:hypothetical protein
MHRRSLLDLSPSRPFALLSFPQRPRPVRLALIISASRGSELKNQATNKFALRGLENNEATSEINGREEKMEEGMKTPASPPIFYATHFANRENKFKNLIPRPIVGSAFRIFLSIFMFIKVIAKEN